MVRFPFRYTVEVLIVNWSICSVAVYPEHLAAKIAAETGETVERVKQVTMQNPELLFALGE